MFFEKFVATWQLLQQTPFSFKGRGDDYYKKPTENVFLLALVPSVNTKDVEMSLVVTAGPPIAMATTFPSTAHTVTVEPPPSSVPL